MHGYSSFQFNSHMNVVSCYFKSTGFELGVNTIPSLSFHPLLMLLLRYEGCFSKLGACCGSWEVRWALDVYTWMGNFDNVYDSCNFVYNTTTKQLCTVVDLAYRTNLLLWLCCWDTWRRHREKELNVNIRFMGLSGISLEYEHILCFRWINYNILIDRSIDRCQR
jgi:hypothetical protein